MSFLPATWRWNGYQAFVLCFQWGLPAFLFVSVGILGWFCQEEGRCNDVSMATVSVWRGEHQDASSRLMLFSLALVCVGVVWCSLRWA